MLKILILNYSTENPNLEFFNFYFTLCWVKYFILYYLRDPIYNIVVYKTK